MKITRNGIDYELTWQEMREAYVAMRREYTKEDILSRLEEMDVDLSEEDIETVIDITEGCLDNNDSYWESYWMTIEYAINNRNTEIIL